MKKPLLLSLALILITLPIMWYYLYKQSDNKAKKTNFHKQLGTYALDMKKTVLGIYNKNFALYKNLRITFLKDSTFIMNMQVPFVYDSVGR